jgi:internalin A
MKLVLAKSKRSISFMMILALILSVGYFLDGKVYGSTGTDIRIHTNINNLQAIQFKDQVYLKWTGINHAKGYNVYRSNVSGQFEYPVTDFLTTTNNFYLDKNFGTAHNLYYIVKPVFDNSSEGSSSNEAKVEEIKVSKVVLQIDNPVMIINDVFSINIDPAAPAVSPRLENGRTMLPIRSLVETLGGSVSWKPETRQIVINIEDKDIVFTLDQVAYTLNGQNKMFDVAPQIFENRTFVPVRAISQLLQGFTTNWKSDTRQVEILSSTHTINLDTLPPTLPTSPNPTETNIPNVLTDAEKENIVIENMKALETILQPIQDKYPRMIGADWGNQDKFNDAIADAIFAAINRNPRKFKNPFNNLSAYERGPADANASTKPVTVRLFNYGASNMQASYEFYDTQLNNGSYSRSKMEGTILVALYSDDQTTDPRQFRLTIMGFGKGGRTLSTPRNNIIHIPSTILPLNKVVVFNDKNLEAAIRAEINKPRGEVYANDLKDITILNLTGKNITNISALANLTNLKELYLEGNNITEISALANLTYLEWLYLSWNNITDISALAQLINLERLTLSGNKITDISALAKLTYLEWLYIEGNNITDISALANLTKLESLGLGVNNITDISALANLTKLESLGLSGNNITDISALANLTNLKELHLIGNKITDISALANLTKLEWLYLTDNNIRDISALANLRNLHTLELSGNNITDFSVLDRLPYIDRADFDVQYVNKVVVFNDKNLEAAIRAEINKPRGEVYANDLKDITILNLTGKNITNISALANVTNLKELGLSRNNITDIRALANLTKLEWLDLSDNNIRDISALRNLTNLKELYLSGNNITDISALANLTKLEWLYLIENNITDISALANLTNLGWLDLGVNNITDISALANLTNLKELGLSRNKITDISALKNLTNLEFLNLTGNKITDISALRNLTNLKTLYLYGNNITDISALKNLTNLVWLELTGNSIIDISAVANLTKLEWLGLSWNKITDISALANVTNLKELYLSGNKITDISALAKLTYLEWLYIAANNITDISALANLTNLGWLDLGVNNITDISALANLTNLKELGLSRNRITDISALKNLTNLEFLNLTGNKITDISALENLTNLEWLDLTGNSITDISALANLTKLEWLELSGNNITDFRVLDRLPYIDRAYHEGQ